MCVCVCVCRGDVCVCELGIYIMSIYMYLLSPHPSLWCPVILYHLVQLTKQSRNLSLVHFLTFLLLRACGHVLMRDEGKKEGRNKQGHTNNKAKQHNTK